MLNASDYNRGDSVSTGVGITKNYQTKKEPPLDRVVFYWGWHEDKLDRT